MKRPPRKYVKHTKIVEYWAGRGLLSDGMWPACMGCAHGVDDWSRLDRAHLVDRCRDGLDHEPNLSLLCGRCHKVMPSFGPDEGDAAIQWVKDRPHWQTRDVMSVAIKVLTDPSYVDEQTGGLLSPADHAQLREWATNALQWAGERKSA